MNGFTKTTNIPYVLILVLGAPRGKHVFLSNLVGGRNSFRGFGKM